MIILMVLLGYGYLVGKEKYWVTDFLCCIAVLLVVFVAPKYGV